MSFPLLSGRVCVCGKTATGGKSIHWLQEVHHDSACRPTSWCGAIMSRGRGGCETVTSPPSRQLSWHIKFSLVNNIIESNMRAPIWPITLRISNSAVVKNSAARNMPPNSTSRSPNNETSSWRYGWLRPLRPAWVTIVVKRSLVVQNYLRHRNACSNPVSASNTLSTVSSDANLRPKTEIMWRRLRVRVRVCENTGSEPAIKRWFANWQTDKLQL